MAGNSGWFAGGLRDELNARSHDWARARPHVESYGGSPVIVFAPDDEQASGGSAPRHGNFFDPAYAAIVRQPGWMRRFDKIHAQGRSLPRAESGRRWRELDSSMSSDALLMNIFCAPGVTESGVGEAGVAESSAVRRALGIDQVDGPEFGWKARVPLANGRFDRTEVDMRWGGLLVEAKLTETDFQTRSAGIVENYRDFAAVFDRDLLPRVEIRTARRRTAVEFAEAFTQEWEAPAENDEIAREFQSALVATGREAEPAEPGFASYQLIRNVLAAFAENCSFCVLHDARRPDLREAWFQVMAAVKSAEMRTRCKVMTWQEVAGLVPEPLREFLELKYGIFA